MTRTLSAHGPVNVQPVACLQDNYAYLLWLEGSSDAIIVDASAARPIKTALATLGLKPRAIFTTHHHPDHTGGNASLAEEYGLPIYASWIDRDRVPGCTHPVRDGQTLRVAGLEFSVMHLPGHTQGALCYLTHHPVAPSVSRQLDPTGPDGSPHTSPAVVALDATATGTGSCACFVGDTLFCGGCGRLKEGTAEQLFASLQRLVRSIPAKTICFTGHEYTEANLRFARTIEPQNVALQPRYADVVGARRRGAFTAAATLELELLTNPFLRTAEAAVVEGCAMAMGSSAADVFKRMRQLKDEA